MRKRQVVLVAIAIAIFGGLIVSTSEVNALGGFLKNLKKDNDTKVTEQKDSKAQVSSEPVEYINTKYKFKFKYPGNWTLKDDDATKSSVTVMDENGNKGSFAVTSTWMSDDFPVDPAFKALVDKAEQRKKHGEVESYFVKNISVKGKDGKPSDVVKGVVVIESDEDPDYKRFQWEAYGGGNYYNFCNCANVANFPNYKKQFEDIINSIQFDFAK